MQKRIDLPESGIGLYFLLLVASATSHMDVLGKNGFMGFKVSWPII